MCEFANRQDALARGDHEPLPPGCAQAALFRRDRARIRLVELDGHAGPGQESASHHQSPQIVGSSPEKFQKFIVTDDSRWKKFAQDTGLKPERTGRRTARRRSQPCSVIKLITLLLYKFMNKHYYH